MLVRNAVSALAALGLALGLAGRARGDDANAPRVSVHVKGHAAATADAVEVELTVDGSAEESSEAKKKYRDKLARVIAALKDGEPRTKAKKPKKEDEEPKKKPAASGKGAKKADDDEDEAPKKPAKGKKGEDADEDSPKKPAKEKKDDEEADAKPSKDAAAIPVEISERGLAVGAKDPKAEGPRNNVMVFGMGGGNNAEKTEKPMHFASKVVATIKDLAKLDRGALVTRLAGLIDSAVDSGADGADATAPTVRFLAEDPEALRKAAYKDAMKRARERAAELATLAGRKLGQVVSVTEVPAVAVDSKTREAFSVLRALGGESGAPEGASTIDLGFEVELNVTFALD